MDGPMLLETALKELCKLSDGEKLENSAGTLEDILGPQKCEELAEYLFGILKQN
jgi:hypothetical protein